jgi:hypothetical protein
MTDRELDDWVAAIDAEIAAGRIQLKFWMCPDGHSDRHSGTPMPDGPTVEWRGNVAHCLKPGCNRTSAEPEGGETP